MTTQNCLSDEFRWRAVGKLEPAQSQVEVARWLQVLCMVVSRSWQQFQTTGTIIIGGLDKVAQESQDNQSITMWL